MAETGDSQAASSTAAPEAEKQPAPVRYRGIITASVILATVMQTLDTTIANVALPRMQGELAATQDEMSWVLTSYVVASAIMIPLTGWLANQFGRRRVFLSSIALFTVVSLLCGFATSLPELVLFRFLQGVGGAALVPLTQATLLDIYPPKEFGRAMAMFVAGSNLGPILGPVLGGWLTEEYSWRAVFYINLPIGIISFMGLLLTTKERPVLRSSGFDFFGFGALSVGLTSLQLMLDRGQLLDWFSSREIITETVISGLAFYLFVVHVFTYPHPFLNPALFRDRNFTASAAFILLLGVVLFSTMALLPPMTQNQLRYPVELTGWLMVPRGIGMILSLFVVGRIARRFGPRTSMALGLTVLAYASWLMTQFSLLMGYQPIAISGLLQGIGIGMLYVPVTTVAFSTLSASLRNEGTAFVSLLRNIGSSVGISVVTFMLTRNTQRMHAALAADITPYNVTSNPALAAAHIDMTTAKGLAALDASITAQATMIAYLDDFHLMMVLTLLTFPVLLLIRGRPPAPGAATVLAE